MNVFMSMAIQLFIVGLIMLVVGVWVYSDDLKHFLRRMRT